MESLAAMGDQVSQYLYDSYKNIVPSSVRTFGESLAGNTSPINENNFSAAELAILKTAAINAEKKGESQIGYGDYGEKNPWAQGMGQIKSAIFDQGGSLANTLGMANIRRDKDNNIIIDDMYDWFSSREKQAQMKKDGKMPNLLQALIQAGPMGALNLTGNKMFPDGEGRPVSIKIP